MRIDQTGFAESADLVAREYTLHLVARVDQACARLGDHDDADAVHDLRVALRHLRSWLRSLREVMPVSPTARRRLRRLARRTNPARDAEVALEYLGTDSAHLASASGFARAWLHAHLAHAAERSRRRACKCVRRDWARLADRLRRETAGRPPRRKGTAPFGAVLAIRLEHLLGELLEIAARPLTPGVQHRVRICGKRLRYLVEPIEGACPQAGALLDLLRDMQDRLGEVNDLWQMGQRIARLVARAARERARKLCALAAQPVCSGEALLGTHRRDPAPDLARVLRSILTERDTALSYNTRDLPAMLTAIDSAARELIECVAAATRGSGPLSRP